MPQDKIRKISSSYPNNPLSPFYDPSGKPMLPVAKLTLRKLKSRNSQCQADQTSGEATSQQYSIGDANDPDFDFNDLSNFMRRSQFLALDSNVASKKSKNSKDIMRFIGKPVYK